MVSGRVKTEGKAGSTIRIAFAILMIALIMIAGPRSARTQGVINREPKMKAQFFFQFINYTTWPAEAFDTPDDPLVIGVVGKDPVNRYLRAVAKKGKLKKRPLQYRPITKAAETKGCHIIFVGDKANPTLAGQVVATARNGALPILLVGESPGFIAQAPPGGTIEFFVAQNRLGFKLSRGAAKGANLKISSQLAKLAEVLP